MMGMAQLIMHPFNGVELLKCKISSTIKNQEVVMNDGVKAQSRKFTGSEE